MHVEKLRPFTIEQHKNTLDTQGLRRPVLLKKRCVSNWANKNKSRLAIIRTAWQLLEQTYSKLNSRPVYRK